MDMGKPTAQSSSAGINKEIGASPLHWNDKCFLCSREIGETDPRGFYQGSSAMMLCHRGCLNLMNAHGGNPEDYHRAALAGQGQPMPTGPSWLDFPDLAAMVNYVRDKGDIPSGVKVTVAGKTIQDG